MPQICFDENKFYFPPVDEADEEGLLLIGGKVTPARIIEAYQKGIFPWYDNDSLPLWFSPNPRFVLLPNELHVSHSMQKLLSKNIFEFTRNTAFEKVIHDCAATKRKDQAGTWITSEMKDVYKKLHKEGCAHSAEAWKENELVGGMYGIQLGKVFFGESMFSKETNASKFAFVKFVQYLKQKGIELIDCQVHTSHVESLGGKLIPRQEYLTLLQNLVSK
jgi:leucyl/phenylalanyl-tRNA--protein transferase